MDAGTRAVQDWTKRFYEAQHDFSEFDAAKMKILLGNEDWERISNMGDLRYTAPVGRNPASSGTERTQPRPPLVNVGNANAARLPAATWTPPGTLAGRKRGRGDMDD